MVLLIALGEETKQGPGGQPGDDVRAPKAFPRPIPIFLPAYFEGLNSVAKGFFGSGPAEY